MTMATIEPTTTQAPVGGHLVSSEGRVFPLIGTRLSVKAAGGIARAVLEQRFRNPTDATAHVRYQLPLPADGAVSGYSFRLGQRLVRGEVLPRAAARERFERAIVSGRTAALLDEERTSLFSQRLGNVPAGAEVVVEVTVDQPLRWLEEGAWEWRFPTVVGARYQGEAGRVADAASQNVPVSLGGVRAGTTLALSIADALTGAVDSPSHPLEQHAGAINGVATTEVSFPAGRRARLDRDVVVRWPVALTQVSASVQAARPAAGDSHGGDTFALLTLAPPTQGAGRALARDLIVLIDTSGSMGGRPLDQAKQVVAALIETLGSEDTLELIEFGSRAKRFLAQPSPMNAGNKRRALKWLNALRASGCTEMHRAVIEALTPLREASQRQVVLVTDGYVGFEQQIVSTLLRDLPRGARLHTVGVGSAVNRTLTEGAARAGRGVELIVGLDEDAEVIAQRLVVRTSAPLVTDLVLEGEGVLEAAPRALPDLFAETPALIAVRARAGTEVVLRGQTADGPYEQRLTIPALEAGQGHPGVTALFGREKVKDLETRINAGEGRRELDAAIEAVGVDFQLATRLTSYVAVTTQVTVEAPAEQTLQQPHELPYGTSAEGLGLRGAASADAKAKRPLAQPPALGLGSKEEAEELRAPLRGISKRAATTTEFDFGVGGEDDDEETAGLSRDLDVLREEVEEEERASGFGGFIPAEADLTEPEFVVPSVEVPSIAGDFDADAALVEVGSDKAMEAEAFELMDERADDWGSAEELEAYDPFQGPDSIPQQEAQWSVDRADTRLTRDGAMLGARPRGAPQAPVHYQRKLPVTWRTYVLLALLALALLLLFAWLAGGWPFAEPAPERPAKTNAEQRAPAKSQSAKSESAKSKDPAPGVGGR